MRARELYKAVSSSMDEDPEITPTWDRRGEILPPFPWKKSKRNPAIVSQVNRARLGFVQIDAGLNYYGLSATPRSARALSRAQGGRRPLRRRRARSAVRFPQLHAAARPGHRCRNADAHDGRQGERRHRASRRSSRRSPSSMSARSRSRWMPSTRRSRPRRPRSPRRTASSSSSRSFMGGMKDSVGKLGEMAFAGESEAEAASAQNLSTGDILKLGYKIGSATGVLGGATSALAGAAGVAGPFGAFLYAGVTSMQSTGGCDRQAGRRAQHLEKVALPAAKALVGPEEARRDHRAAFAGDREGRLAARQRPSRLLRHAAAEPRVPGDHVGVLQPADAALSRSRRPHGVDRGDAPWLRAGSRAGHHCLRLFPRAISGAFPARICCSFIWRNSRRPGFRD